MPEPLGWGRRYLMCPPRHFGVLYEINPWMHREVAVDPARSRAQWDDLVETLSDAGAEIEAVEAVEGLPDMVFTANAGVVEGNRVVLSRFRHPERSGEEKHYEQWFHNHGFEVAELRPVRQRDRHAEPPHFEGAGDALPFRGRIVAGYMIRSDYDAHTELARLLGTEVLSVELVDPRFYHIDLTFCPLDDQSAIVVPQAWDAYGREVLRNLVPDPITLEAEEALAFSANSVVVGRTVVMPSCTPRLCGEIERRGFEVVVSDVSEFLKAGGGVRCLTLALDVRPSG